MLGSWLEIPKESLCVNDRLAVGYNKAEDGPEKQTYCDKSRQIIESFNSVINRG